MSSCPQEPHVMHAVAANAWTDALRTHAAQCDDCSAAAEAAPFMIAFARPHERQRPLPDPAILWLKAQLLGGQAAAQRAARPLNVVQLIAYVVIGAGWASLVTWKWSDVQRWFFSFTPSSVVGELAGIQPAVSAAVIVAFLVLSSLTVMLALHAILAEE